MIEHIFLIGYRAAGKTTIGRPLADALGFDFLDTDDLVCQKQNADVSRIVEKEGWDCFRKYEAEALLEASRGQKRVVATGGGAILHDKQWQKIRGTAFIVWLSADVKTLSARLQVPTGVDSSRPSLTGGAIHFEIENVLSERIPLYRKYANLIVDTGQYSTSEVVDIIVAAYRQQKREGWR